MLLSSLRRFVAPLVLAGLAACGYSPIYAPGGSGAALYGQVDVQAPTSVITYRMVQEVEAQLGRSAAPTYRLTYTFKKATESLAITADNATLRYNLIGKLDYTLSQANGSNVIASGQVMDFVGYSAAGSSLETLSAERDAEQRLGVALANRLVTRLHGTVTPAPDATTPGTTP